MARMAAALLVNPARAGMILSCCERGEGPRGKPRASGDDPGIPVDRAHVNM